MQNKTNDLDQELIQSSIYDSNIIASRKNKPLTINSSELKKTKVELNKSKLESIDSYVLNEEDNMVEFDKYLLSQGKSFAKIETGRIKSNIKLHELDKVKS